MKIYKVTSLIREQWEPASKDMYPHVRGVWAENITAAIDEVKKEYEIRRCKFEIRSVEYIMELTNITDYCRKLL